MKTYYHVYSEGGFESAHRTARSAERAAKRCARRQRQTVRIIATDVHGVTGGARGALVAEVSP